MTVPQTAGGRPWGRLILIGGGLAMIAVLFPWARVITDRTVNSVRGTSAGEALAALACGALLILLGRSVGRSQPPAGRAAGVAAAALGLVILGLSVHVLATHDQQIVDGVRQGLEADGAGPANPGAVREAHAELVREGLEATFGPGVYLAVAGGVLAALGGIGAAARASAVRGSLGRPDIVPAVPGPEAPTEPREESDRWGS
jgi:hypothetical protein